MNPLLLNPSDPAATSTVSQFGSLTVIIHRGYVKHDDFLTKGDIFVKLFVSQREIGRTATARDTYYPAFERKFVVSSLSRNDVIKFELWDEDSNGNEYEGSITTTCDEVISERVNKKKRSYYHDDHKLFMTISCLGF